MGGQKIPIDIPRIFDKEESKNIALEYSLSSLFTAYGNIIYTFGQNISKDEPMRRIPPLNGRFDFRYRDQKGIKASTDWIFALKQDHLSNGDIADDRIQEGGTPGWKEILPMRLTITAGRRYGLYDIILSRWNLRIIQ